MIKSDRLLKNSVNNLFYLHPTKCGGVSVYACLNEMNAQFYFTHEIQLNEKYLELLKSDKRIIVTGHIQNLPNPKTDAQKIIMSEILKILYFKSDLIMPTRNPSNLLQSWMHYSKTRSNLLLQSVKPEDKAVWRNNDKAMLYRMRPLRQNCVVFAEDGKTLRKSKDFPQFILQEEDEEWNLLAFADFLKSEKFLLPQLCSMQLQLFATDWAEISKLTMSGKSVVHDLPSTSDKRKVIYYDCENIDSNHQLALDQAICPGFSERLLNTRKNVSEDKSQVKGSDFDSVNKKLQKMIPGEWQIYAMSKVGV